MGTALSTHTILSALETHAHTHTQTSFPYSNFHNLLKQSFSPDKLLHANKGYSFTGAQCVHIAVCVCVCVLTVAFVLVRSAAFELCPPKYKYLISLQLSARGGGLAVVNLRPVSTCPLTNVPYYYWICERQCFVLSITGDLNVFD